MLEQTRKDLLWLIAFGNMTERGITIGYYSMDSKEAKWENTTYVGRLYRVRRWLEELIEEQYIDFNPNLHMIRTYMLTERGRKYLGILRPVVVTSCSYYK